VQQMPGRDANLDGLLGGAYAVHTRADPFVQLDCNRCSAWQLDGATVSVKHRNPHRSEWITRREPSVSFVH
jgi:hypothetical protein